MLVVRRLVWDDWNIAHIARHDVVPEEVEQVCQNSPMTSLSYNNRLRVIGETKNGRILTVILDPENKSSVYYPVTARVADTKERRNYKEAMKEGAKHE